MTTAPVASVASRRTSASMSLVLPTAQACSGSPPLPSPLSGLGSGPVTNPSSDMEISATDFPKAASFSYHRSPANCTLVPDDGHGQQLIATF